MRARRVWLNLGIAFVVLVVYLSLKTNPLDTGEVVGVKVGHFIAYGWLGLWFAQLHPSKGGRATLFACLVALGIGLEYLQRMTGYRTFRYSDMVDNAIGAAVGIGLALTPLGNVLAALEARWRTK